MGGVLRVLANGADRPEDPASLRHTRRDLSTAYAELVESLTAEEPGDRPQDAEAVLGWLNDIRYMSNVEALIALGEGSEVELKSSLHHAYESLPGKPESEVKKDLRLAVTKTIAAFLNSEGGTLLIGIGDKGDLLGIEADLPYLKKRDLDSWFLELKDVVTAALGKEIWASVQVTLVLHGEATVAVVRCQRRVVETWHRKDGKQVLYVRAGNGTIDVDGPKLVKYVREHWPA